MTRILVTGAFGQIGSELSVALRKTYGNDAVIATDKKSDGAPSLLSAGPIEQLDILDRARLGSIIETQKIDMIYHMAAILSATGEEKPDLCWQVNVDGLKNILDVAVEKKIARVFVPSSIAVYGPDAPKENTTNDAALHPKTMYGVTKVAGERMADYYFHRFGLDCRGLRFPGIISHKTPPGGGTTDYAVAIYQEAVARGQYTCFVKEKTVLPMLYMPDTLRAVIDLMEAPLAQLNRHSDYNLAGMRFSAGDMARSIQKHLPDFVCTFEPDYRQAFAEGWPRSIEDGPARRDWGWAPSFDLDSMTQDMLNALQKG